MFYVHAVVSAYTHELVESERSESREDMAETTPPLATKKQQRWLRKVIRDSGLAVPLELETRLPFMTRTEITVLTDRALVMRSVYTGVPVPAWVVMTPELEAYRGRVRQRLLDRHR